MWYKNDEIYLIYFIMILILIKYKIYPSCVIVSVLISSSTVNVSQFYLTMFPFGFDSFSPRTHCCLVVLYLLQGLESTNWKVDMSRVCSHVPNESELYVSIVVYIFLLSSFFFLLSSMVVVFLL